MLVDKQRKPPNLRGYFFAAVGKSPTGALPAAVWASPNWRR